MLRSLQATQEAAQLRPLALGDLQGIGQDAHPSRTGVLCQVGDDSFFRDRHTGSFLMIPLIPAAWRQYAATMPGLAVLLLVAISATTLLALVRRNLLALTFLTAWQR